MATFRFINKNVITKILFLALFTELTMKRLRDEISLHNYIHFKIIRNIYYRCFTFRVNFVHRIQRIVIIENQVIWKIPISGPPLPLRSFPTYWDYECLNVVFISTFTATLHDHIDVCFFFFHQMNWKIVLS